MTAEQSFNKRIKRFLSEQPQSDASDIIRQVEKQNPDFTSHYELFDDFVFKLGLRILVQEIVSKNHKTIGYIPSIEYYPNNLLKEEPRVAKLVSKLSPLSLNKSYEYLAKELLYRLMRVSDFNALILGKE